MYLYAHVHDKHYYHHIPNQLHHLDFCPFPYHPSCRLVLLEVYKPSGSKKGAPFRKSNPGPPDFRVMIVR